MIIARRLSVAACVAALVAVTLCSPALAKKPAVSYYLTPAQVDLSQLLEPPPPPASAAAIDDARTMATVMADRSPADIADAAADAHRTVFTFANVLGPNFVAERLPLTVQLFAHTSGDTEALIDVAKAYFDRPRPEGAPQTHGSYPSGHAAFAACTAILLAEMVPETRKAIFRRAEIFADRRIVAGVHYPTDVEAGWIAGTIVAYALMREPRFESDFAAARAEVRATLGLPVAATSQGVGAFGEVLTSQK
jgi:acid phosphatase (class A)